MENLIKNEYYKITDDLSFVFNENIFLDKRTLFLLKKEFAISQIGKIITGSELIIELIKSTEEKRRIKVFLLETGIKINIKSRRKEDLIYENEINFKLQMENNKIIIDAVYELNKREIIDGYGKSNVKRISTHKTYQDKKETSSFAIIYNRNNNIEDNNEIFKDESSKMERVVFEEIRDNQKYTLVEIIDTKKGSHYISFKEDVDNGLETQTSYIVKANEVLITKPKVDNITILEATKEITSNVKSLCVKDFFIENYDLFNSFYLKTTENNKTLKR